MAREGKAAGWALREAQLPTVAFALGGCTAARHLRRSVRPQRRVQFNRPFGALAAFCASVGRRRYGVAMRA